MVLYLPAGEEGEVDGNGQVSISDQADESSDPVQRRAFKPPRRKRRPRRKPTPRSFSIWDMRDGLGYGLTRAVCAIGFGSVPAVGERFGDAALAVVASGLAVMVLVIVAALLRVGRPTEWRLVADALTLVVLIPVLATASAIEVADARLGGRSVNFMAAAAATVLIYLIVVIAATRAGADRNASTQIGALPGALSITAILLGTSHFSAGDLWRGLTISWMAAAFVTLCAMFVSLRVRAAVAPAALALFAMAIVVLQTSANGGGTLSSESSAVAMFAVAAVAIILVLIPIPQRRRHLPHASQTDEPFSTG